MNNGKILILHSKTMSYSKCQTDKKALWKLIKSDLPEDEKPSVSCSGKLPQRLKVAEKCVAACFMVVRFSVRQI